jgi:hypothetical protein
VLVGEPFKRGDILVVRLGETPDDAAETLLVRVTNARQQPGQRRLLGCAFARSLSENELDLLVRRHKEAAAHAADVPPRESEKQRGAADPFVGGGAHERRGGARRGGPGVTVLLCRAGTREAPLRGWVYDRSTSGLALCAPHGFAPGTLLKVRLEHGQEDAPWVQFRVKSCQLKAKQWHLGCQLTEAVPSHVLMLFG